MTDKPTQFSTHALSDGDTGRCACQLGPGASREQILTYERKNG